MAPLHVTGIFNVTNSLLVKLLHKVTSYVVDVLHRDIYKMVIEIKQNKFRIF